jgi:hypothetical protein
MIQGPNSSPSSGYTRDGWLPDKAAGPRRFYRALLPQKISKLIWISCPESCWILKGVLLNINFFKSGGFVSLRAALKRIPVFWDVISCRLIFTEIFEKHSTPCNCFSLKMETLISSETLVCIYQSSWPKVQEDWNILLDKFQNKVINICSSTARVYAVWFSVLQASGFTVCGAPLLGGRSPTFWRKAVRYCHAWFQDSAAA